MIRRFILFIAAACLVVTSFAAPAFAAELSLGLGGGWQSSPYKGHDDEIMPIPIVRAEWERFYIDCFDAGAHIWKNDNQALSLGVTYGGGSFNSDETDDAALRKLKDRDTTLSAFLQYRIKSDYGHAGIKILRDVLGNSDAFSAEAFYKYPVALGPVQFSFGGGMQWDSKEQLDYYYGISSSEARKSGLKKYSPSGGFSPFVSLETVWSITDHWSATLSGKALFLSEEIKDSPMVNTDQVFNASFGLLYTF